MREISRRLSGTILFFFLLIVLIVPTMGQSPGNVSTNLELWLKADAGVEEGTGNPAEDGDRVSGWLDQSGNGLDASQSTNFARPFYYVNQANSYPLLRFASGGTADYLDLGDVLDFTPQTDSWTFIAVFFVDNGDDGTLLSRASSGTETSRQYQFFVSGDEFRQIIGGTLNDDGSNSVVGNWAIGTAVINPSTVNSYVDGALDDPGVPGTATETTNVLIGARSSGGGFQLDGDIAEIIMYSSALSATDQRDVESYLALKYGVSIDISSVGYTVGGVEIYTPDATFDNDISGIGTDTNQGLDLTTSQSINTSSILSIGSASDQDDGEFLVWANNGGSSTALTGDYNAITDNGSARIWKVEETGDLGTVTITVDKADLPSEVRYIYIKNGDPSLGTGGTATALVDGGTTWTVTVDLADGDYFSFIGVAEISVEGNAVSIADGDVTPDAADHTEFGSTDINAGLISHTFTIYNTGTIPMSLSGSPEVVIGGADASDFAVVSQPGTTIAAGGNATFTIEFNPSALALRTATVTIDNNDSDENPFTFSIQGTGANLPEISIEGNSVEIVSGDNTPDLADDTRFGNTFASVVKTFTIINNGTADLNLAGSPTVSISGDAEFVVSAQPAALVSSGGGSVTFDITFTPLTIGAYSATISIDHDDNDGNNENPYTFAVDGTFYPGPGGVGVGLSLWLKADVGVEEADGDPAEDADNVRNWLDQSGGSSNAQQTVGASQPIYEANSINGNAALRFDNDYITGSDGFYTREFFVVVDPDFISSTSEATGDVLGYQPGDVGSLELGSATVSISDELITHVIDGSGGYRAAFTDPTGEVVLANPMIINDRLNASFDGQNLFLNGRQVDDVYVTSGHQNFDDEQYIIGNGFDFADDFQGGVAEVISYEGRLSDEQQKDIFSYLGVKYGITLDEDPSSSTVNYDYQTNEGATIIWPGSSDAGYQPYHNDVAGIGRNVVEQELNQTSGKSINDATILSVSNPDDIEDGEYMLWGNDGAENVFVSTDVIDGATERLQKIWRVKETGDVGTVTLTFDITNLAVDKDNTTLNLVITSTGATMPNDLDNPAFSTMIAGGSVLSAGGKDLLVFDAVDLSDGDYFTLAGDVQTISPGGVSSGLTLWLKADEGVTTTGSSLVTAWSDVSGNGNDADQGDDAQKPTLLSNEINFNEAVDFTDDFLDGLAGFNTHEFFFVLKPDLPVEPTSDIGFIVGFRNGSYDGFSLGNQAGDGVTGTTAMAVYAYDTYRSANTGGTIADPVILFNSRNDLDVSPAGQEIYANSVQIDNFEANAGSFGNRTNSFFRLGNNFTSSETYDGKLAEVISYNRKLTDVERRDVESYLAIKYGVSIDISSTGLTLSGVDIYPGSATYDADLAGIGFNLDHSLDQPRSTSSNPGAVVTIESPSDFDTGDYLIWANDGTDKSLSQTSELSAEFDERLQTEWLVAVTGDPGSVTVKMYVADVNNYALRPSDAPLWTLLVNDSDDFSSVASAIQASSFSGDTLVFENVNFGDGDFFTLSIPPVLVLPGSGNTLWLKADKGVSTNLGMITWLDQSGSGNDAVQSGGTTSTGVLSVNSSNIIEGNGLDRNFVAGPLTGQTIIYAGQASSSGASACCNGFVGFDGDKGIRQDDDGETEYRSNGPNSNGDDWTNGGTFYYDGVANTSANVPNIDEFHVATAERTGTVTGDFYIGGYYPGRYIDNSRYAEIIVYDGILSAADRANVETYLSLKYGLALALPISLDGTPLYNNTAYPDDVAGIGAKAEYGYYKDISGSYNSDDIVTMSEPSSLNNEDFLVWGNDDGSTSQTNVVSTGLPTSITEMMERKWAVVETNDVGTVTVEFDLNGLGFGTYNTSDFRLILDDDDDPSNGVLGVVSAESFNASVASFKEVEFSGVTNFYLGTGINLVSDADTDGIPDYFEVAYGTNPGDGNDPVSGGSPNTDADLNGANGPNGDGISDALEQILISNGASAPVTRLTDSDGDGTPDHLEVSYGWNPFNANQPYAGGDGDGDNDGLPDMMEILIFLLNGGVDITTLDLGVDTDGDGLPDDIEVLYAYNPADPDDPQANGDNDDDGDGVTNTVEWGLGVINIDIGTDTDADGVPDYFEYISGYDSNDVNDPTVAGGTDDNNDDISDAMIDALTAFGVTGPISVSSDNDSDGLPDFIEAYTYTDPLTAASPALPVSLNIRTLQADYQSSGSFCADLNGYQWVNITDNVGNVVYSINPVGHDLGTTCFAVRILSGAGNVRTDNSHYILNRNIWISPTTQPDLLTINHQVYVRLYAPDDESQDLQAKVGSDGFTIDVGDLEGFISDSIKFTKISGIETLDPFVTGGTRELIDPVTLDFGADATVYTFGVSSFSSLVPHNAPSNPEAILPVEWLTFTGSGRNGAVSLKWSTASEINNDYFEVERSLDGKNFKAIGRVEGSGTVNHISEYHYTDLAAPAGVLFYRLHQVDFDGKFDFSEVIRVDNASDLQSFGATLYPNPSRSSVYIRIASDDLKTPVTIAVYDLFGKAMMQSELPAESINNDYEILPGVGLTAGVYLIKLQQGKQTSTLRLIRE